MDKLALEQMAIKNTIVRHYAGSIAYGTNTETSDIDIRGVFVGDEICYRTPFFNMGESTLSDEEDGKLYELNKFAALCATCNPNIMESLWVDEKDIICKTKPYDLLRYHRSDFLSKLVATKYVSYANEQLKKIVGHNKWITNPQSPEPPRQVDFVKMVCNYTDDKILPGDFSLLNYRDNWRLIPYGNNMFGLHKAERYQTFSDDFTLNTVLDQGQRSNYRVPSFVLVFNKENYELSRRKWSQYWSWKENRNEDRGILEEKYGYDTQHAAHLIRLLRMGCEILETGICLVKRPDAKELMAIRYDGIMSYEEVVEYSNRSQERIEQLLKKTKLPDLPNYEKIGRILIKTQDLHFAETRKNEKKIELSI